MLLKQSLSSGFLRLAFMLAGVALGVGLLVLVRNAQIPFFLYYPRVTNTVLLSVSLDTYLFALATLSVPASLVVLILQTRKRDQFRVFPTFVLVFAALVWLLSFVLILNDPLLSALGLYASTVMMVAVNLQLCGRVYDLERRRVVSDLLTPMMMIFALIEFASIYHWIFSSVDPGTQIGLQAAELEANLTYSPFLLADFLLMALLFSWLWIPPVFRVLKVANVQEIIQGAVRMPGRRAIAASIDLIAILAIAVTFYPYSAGQQWLVGVDSLIRYYYPLTDVSGLSISNGLHVLSSTFHGVYVGLLFLLQRATGLAPFLIVKFAPLVLAFLTAVIIFWMLLNSTGSYRLATLSSVCSILWIPTTLGIFAGLQSNWAALVLWMLFLALTIWSTRSQSKRATVFILQAVVSAAILAIHPWTWGVFVATLVIFAVIAHLQDGEAAHASLRSIFAALVLAVPAGIAGTILALNMRKEALSALQNYVWLLSRPNQTALLGDAIYQGYAQWASFLSPLLLAISLLGAASLVQHKGFLGKYVLAWIVACSIGSILAAPVGYDPTSPALSEPLLWRVLYISPLPILLAFGIEKAWQLVERLQIATPSRLHAHYFTSILTAALCSGLLVISTSPIVKLVAVLAALTACLVLAFKQGPQAVMTLVVMTLLLIVANAAFRSLYPLLLDPHNLLGTWSGWSAP
jgi:hypothetical protein